MNRILDIDNFRLSFYGPNGRVPAVQGVNLYVNEGETVALVGESGCGKTALCRAILGLHSSHAKVEDGGISLSGVNVTEMTDRQLEAVRGKDAAMVFQDPMTFLNPTFSIGSQISDAILLHEKISKPEAKAKAVELLKMVEIPQAEIRYKQYPHHFSGGMRQRVAIAIALACNPTLIIADEPTTALDIKTQNEVMILLKRLCIEQGKAMLLVTHDLGLAENLADRTAVMKDGKIIEQGNTEEIFDNPREEYTKKLLGYVAYGKGTSHYHGNYNKKIKGLEKEKVPAITIEHLDKIFPLDRKTSKTVLKDFNLTINKGEIVGLVGPSGSGKSTLARCIMDIYEPDGGRIVTAEGLKMQMIFQDSASAFNPRMKLWEIIAEPADIEARRERRRMGKKELRVMAQEAAEACGLEKELLERYP